MALKRSQILFYLTNQQLFKCIRQSKNEVKTSKARRWVLHTHYLKSLLELSSLTAGCIIRPRLHIPPFHLFHPPVLCLPDSPSSLQDRSAKSINTASPSATSRVSDQIKQSESDMFPWPDGWAPGCEVLMSVGTSISSARARRCRPSGEQLEPEERETSQIPPRLFGSGSRQR